MSVQLRSGSFNVMGPQPYTPPSPVGLKPLAQGSTGPDVAALQGQLARAGFPVAADGIFGPRTEASLKQFQAKNGLPATGTADLATMQALRGSSFERSRTTSGTQHTVAAPNTQVSAPRTNSGTGLPVMKAGALAQANPARTAGASSGNHNTLGSTLHASAQATVGKPTQGNAATATANPARARELAQVDTSRMTEAQKFEHYKALTVAGGGTFDSTPGARNIVGIRHPDTVNAGGTDKNGLHTGVFDDRIAVAWQDKDGTKHVKEFTANTDPAEKWVATDGRDVNGDGTREAGRLPAGFHQFKISERTGKHQGEPALRPTADVMLERDMNHDGLFNDNTRTSGGNSVLFHPAGGNNSTGSAGCQTIKDNDWPAFWGAVKPATNGGNIGYTLVQVD